MSRTMATSDDGAETTNVVAAAVAMADAARV